MSSTLPRHPAVPMPDLVARDLLTAALARIVFTNTRIEMLGYAISCTADGGEIQIRDGAGALLDRLEVSDFIRLDIDADIEAATAQERIEPTGPRG